MVHLVGFSQKQFTPTCIGVRATSSVTLEGSAKTVSKEQGVIVRAGRMSAILDAGHWGQGAQVSTVVECTVAIGLLVTPRCSRVSV